AHADIRKLLKHDSRLFQDNWIDLQVIHYLGGYGLPFLEAALRDSDAGVRACALYAAADMVHSAHLFNALVSGNWGTTTRPFWAIGLVEEDEKIVRQTAIRMALAGLNDVDAYVRVVSVDVLRQVGYKEALTAVKRHAEDPDSSVRSAVQKYLTKFAQEPGV